MPDRSSPISASSDLGPARRTLPSLTAAAPSHSHRHRLTTALQSAGKKEPKTLTRFMALMEDPDLVTERDSYVQSMLARMMENSRGD